MSEEKALLNLELMIDDNQTAIISIKESDDVEEVINTFCGKHNFPDSIKGVIMTQLMEALNSNIDECNTIYKM